jgi:hypothetical protein
LRRPAHLGCHHREATARVARVRHRGVEGQQIGLPRDLVDAPNDVGDRARGLLDGAIPSPAFATTWPLRLVMPRALPAEAVACGAFSAVLISGLRGAQCLILRGARRVQMGRPG